MAARREGSPRQSLRTRLKRSWRSVIRGVVRAFALAIIVFVVLYPLIEGQPQGAGRFNSLFVITLCCLSIAYLLFVSSRVRLRLPGIDERLIETEQEAHRNGAGGTRLRGVGLFGRKARHTTEQGDTTTIQVTRLSTEAARITVENQSPLPVLHAEATLTLVHEDEDMESSSANTKLVKGKSFSIPAHGAYPAAVGNAFDHVGIYRMHSAGIRIYGLLGVLSRLRGRPGEWRVRVVPNIYRLAYGIPRDRSVRQSELGIPDSPADALDYDRVRDYRPGDPLKTIHWKLVAHGQGDLYTKLFETSTVSSVTLVIDPYGPDCSPTYAEDAYRQHDTMLEGSFSLVEHARENGIAGQLHYVSRSGSLVETRWAGRATLGLFVETARRPAHGQDALQQSVRAIDSLRSPRAGYVIFATSRLSPQTVEALVSCHHAGVSLLVVHALPEQASPNHQSQLAFDERLRKESITVVSLHSGSQIVREVTTT